MAAVAGKFGRVTIAGSNLRFDKWKVNTHGVDIPTTNFEDINAAGRTFTSGIVGPEEADVEASGYYDDGTGGGFQPWVTMSLRPGPLTPAGGFLFQTSKAGGTIERFNFPSLRIISASEDCDVNGRVNFSFQGKSNGPYKVPGEA